MEIKHRWSGAVLFSCELGSLKAVLELAVSGGADLRDANLRGADLRGADLRGADLRGADLRDAHLCGANLRGADLRGADLRGADLRGANLCDADLCGANLRGADLCDADLCGANLRGADLRGADLCGANLCDADLCDANLCDADLTPIRDDFWAVLSSAPADVRGLRAMLAAGRINGSAYEGQCACLVGTMANLRNVRYDQLDGLVPNPARPAERFFLNIKEGDTPGNNQSSKLALEWTDMWLKNIEAAFGAKP